MDAYLQQVGVNRMDWPACSSDFNPFEHVWDELDRWGYNHIPPTDSQNLFQMLQAEWQALPQRYFTGLVNSMSSRGNECPANNGIYTHY